MRSLNIFGTGRKTSAPGNGTGRPEALRRRTLTTSAMLIGGAGALAAPFALAVLVDALVLPFVVVTIWLGAGIASFTHCRRGRYDTAAALQVYAILATGLVFALVNPAIAGIGLAIGVLGLVFASLLGRPALQKQAWALLAGILGLAGTRAAGLDLWPDPYRPWMEFAGAGVFGILACIVAFATRRLDTAFEGYEKAQTNAYRHLIEHVQDAVMRFSGEGELLFTSKSAERLFGCPRYELQGAGLVERVHILDRPTYMTAFANANRAATPATIEVRMRRDDAGAPARAPVFAWVEIAFSPVTEPGEDGQRGEVRHEIVAMLRDITDRRDRQNEMRRARREAEEASEAKSRFLATIGHELRTPLNAIVGFSEMMTSDIGGELSATHREYAEVIHKSGRHLIEVVKMLLDMSRIEAGKFELQAEPFDPHALVEPCRQMLDGLAREKRVRLSVSIPARLPAIVADERACRQVLINLVSNAIKFSHETGEVTIAMKRQGTQLNISVTDCGVGMSRDAIAHIGEPFFQAQDGLARRYEGTGLGLSIVKGLVDLHEGSLHAVSEAGKGTTITVLLPINGPAIKLSDTGAVTPLHPEAAPDPVTSWPEQKRSAK